MHYLVWLCQKISTSYFRTDTYAIYIIYMRYLKQSLSNLGKHEDQAFECNKIYAKHAHSNGTIRTVCSSKIQQQNPILRPSLRHQIQTFTHIFIWLIWFWIKIIRRAYQYYCIHMLQNEARLTSLLEVENHFLLKIFW